MTRLKYLIEHRCRHCGGEASDNWFDRSICPEPCDRELRRLAEAVGRPVPGLGAMWHVVSPNGVRCKVFLAPDPGGREGVLVPALTGARKLTLLLDNVRWEA